MTAYHVVLSLHQAVGGQHGSFHGGALEHPFDLTANLTDPERLAPFGRVSARGVGGGKELVLAVTYEETRWVQSDKGGGPGGGGGGGEGGVSFKCRSDGGEEGRREERKRGRD